MPPGKLRYEPQEISMQRERLRLLVYGSSKVGKTTLALTAPRAFVIDTDGGLVSGAIQGLSGVTYAPDGWKEFEALYWWAKERADQFDTIVIDSMTMVQRLLIDEIVGATVDKKGANAPIMEFVPEQGMYLANQRQVGRILNDFRMLGKHMIVTAGVKERMGKKSPDLSPGLLTIVNHWASVMGELVVHTKKTEAGQDETLEKQELRALITAPSSEREAGSRFRSLLPYVANPTFDKIWSTVLDEYETASAANGKTKTK